MNLNWRAMLVPSFVVSLLLMVASQYLFIKSSFYKNVGFGIVDKTFGFQNYKNLFLDSFYIDAIIETFMVSGLATVFTILMAYPVAYAIARMKPNRAMILLATIVVSTFITIVIKVFGLIIIFSADGWLNKILIFLGIISEPFTVIGNISGVIVGLIHFCLGFAVLLIYSVVQTIPKSYEEAAQIHGASRINVFLKVIIPITMPGIIIGAITIFNMCMGAFTSAALLGGGRVLTLPVLIQRAVIMEVNYPMAATLAALLLAFVMGINLLSIALLKRFRMTKAIVT